MEIKAVLAGLGVFMFGGWSPVIILLLTFIFIDYLSGLLAAYIEGELSSKIGSVGIAKKIMICLLVAAANKLDIAIDSQGMILTATCFFYIANELLSIIENATRAGLPVPLVLKQGLQLLKKKGGEVDSSVTSSEKE
ncbi:phage holin family protein [Brevibacillus panacihumi]|uniref:phage holin family protein n=1 Tax=Brevibacillus panacihumi TaxID=497735 RepID=UPI003D1FEDC5